MYNEPGVQTSITEDLDTISNFFQEGKVCVFPTETVFGIGCDSRNWESIQRIYRLKKRPSDNPLIVHLHAIEAISEIANIPEYLYPILEQFTPGPISFVLPKKDERIFSNSLSTIAVRIPNHAGFLKILEKSKLPVSAPSANLSGFPSITRESDAIATWNGKVDCIAKLGDCSVGIESTVVDVSSPDSIAILRPGFIEKEDLVPFLPKTIVWKEASNFEKSPGTRYRHYSPNAKVILGLPKEDEPKSFFLGFAKPQTDLQKSILVKNNLEYMNVLYSSFIEADRVGAEKIYCELPRKEKGEIAILNRLEKASLS